MTVKKCDRCGAIYDDNKSKIKFQRGEYIFAELTISLKNYFTLPYDLCDECATKLMGFLERKEETT